MTRSPKEKAVQEILHVLRNPLALLSRLTRQDALDLARKHEITAEELLVAALAKNQQA
jgi:hypothetical protein